MKAGKKLIVALLSAIMIVSIFMFVGCEMPGVGGDSNGGGNPTDKPIEVGEEVGIWYSDTPSGEFILTLVQGGGFTISQADGLKFGTYTKSGDDLALVANSGNQNETFWAKREGDQMTLNMGESSYRLYRQVNYTVTFEVDGGTQIAAATVMNGKAVAKPEDPQKKGYQFIGWYADSELTQEYDFATIVTGDASVYARYEAYVPGQNEFTVNYVVDGEIVATATTVGGKLYNVPTAEKAGAEFAGWWMSDFNDGDYLTAQYVDQIIDENTNLYAVWKGDAPIASVTAQGITWASLGANKKYNVEITDPNGLFYTATTSETVYEYDFTNKIAGEWKVAIICDGKTSTYYYNNKGLAKVSIFNVVGNVLVYAPVENAQKYYVTVVCGNGAHNHAKVDNGTSTSFNFANCQMAEGGIKFVVEAVANGYASSVSEAFVYERKLGEVEGLSVNAEGALVWNAVENAVSYTVTVKMGESTYVENVGAATKYSLKNFSGELSVSVQANAAGYVSAAATEISFVKASLAAPQNVLVKESLLSWNNVEGAEGYNVMIGGKVYTTATNSIVFEDEYATAGNVAYDVQIQAVAKDAVNNSEYSDVMSVVYGIMGTQMSYGNGMISWQPVVGASSYNVSVNNGTAIVVDGGQSSAAITLTANTNKIVVEAFNGDEVSMGEAILTVAAKTVYFDTLGGKEVKPMYKAAGDPMILPEAELTGYEFAGWYNIPGGPAANASQYTDATFQASANLVLFAHYTPMPFQVTLVVGAGESVEKNEITVYYNENYVLPKAVNEDSSKVFGGWYTEINGEGIQYTDPNGESVVPFIDTKDVTLYPGWLDVLAYREADGGKSYSVYSGPGISYVDEITVPETYMGLPVLKVDSFANTKIKTVNLPDTITVVEGTAFDNCSYITAVNVYPTENPAKGNLASKNGVLYQRSSAESTAATVKYYPKALAGVYAIPEYVTFGNVDLPVTYIAQNTFKSNYKITGLYIPWTVETIEDSAFYNATGILSIEFGKTPEGQEEKPLTIGKQAFYYLYKMTELTLPARLADFNPDSFERCTGLTHIGIEEGNEKYKSIDGVLATADGTTIVFCPKGRAGEYVIPAGVTTIADAAFKGCTKLTSLTIPGWVTEIGEEAFSGCTIIDTLKFEGTADDLTLNIGKNAFYNIELTTLDLPANLGKVGAHAFGSITYLYTVNVKAGKDFAPEVNAFGTTAATPVFYVKYLTLGKDVPVIDVTGVFGQKLETVSVEDGNENYSSDSYGALYDKGQTQVVYFPNSYEGAYVLPSTIEVIGARTFMNKKITSITFSYKLKEIGEHAFDNADSLVTAEFEATPEGVEPVDLTIGEFAFTGCNKLQTMVLPERTVYVGNKAFQICAELKQVHFPSTLTEIGYDTGTTAYPTEPTMLVFYNCKKLEAITVAEGNPAFTAIDGILYGKTDGVATHLMACPAGKAGVVNVPGTVTHVLPSVFYNNDFITEVHFAAHTGAIEVQFGEQVFYYARALEKVTLPTGMTTLPTQLFYYNQKLSEIVIPYTVSYIEVNPFYSCSGLKTITFAAAPEGVEEVPLLLADGSYSTDNYGNESYQGAFANLDGITEIVLPARTVTDANNGATGAFAFAGCGNLQSVVLSSNMEEIGEQMFRYAEKLSSVTFDAEPKYTVISKYAFYRTAIREINIPATVHTIETYAFYHSALESVVIPAAVKELPDYIFGYSDKLSSVTIVDTAETPSQLESIGKYVFSSNKLITRFDIPATVKTIAQNAFYGCSNLATVNFKTNADGLSALESVGQNAFNGAGLTSLSFPETANTLDLGTYLLVNGTAGKNNTLTTVHLSSKITAIDDAFAGCNALATMTVSDENQNFKVAVDAPMLLNKLGTAIQYIFGEIKGEFVVPEGYDEIAPRAFENQGALTSIKIAASVKKIGNYAFSKCTSLQSVTFADNSVLTDLGTYVFEKCPSLKSVVLPDNLTALGNYMFDGCEKLESVELPANLTSMGTYVFRNCKSLKEITFPENLTTTGNYAFYGCESLERVNFNDKLTTLGQYIFSNCTSLKAVDLPDSLTTMGMYSFQYTPLESIVIPANVTKLATSATAVSGHFDGCTNLKSVTFEGDVTIMGNYLFRNCVSLTSIELPATITQLGTNSFKGSGIKSIDLSNVTKIGSYAFQDCFDLASVKLGEKLTTIDTYAFFSCTSLTEIDLPASLTTLGNFAFVNTGLKSVTIPAGIVKLGSTLSASNTANTSATGVWQSVTKEEKVFTGGSVFAYNKDLASVTILGDVTSIGACVFMECPNLKSITIPATVKEIGDYAFAWTGLTNVTIPAATTKLGSATSYSAVSSTYPKGKGGSVFEGCTDLSTVVFAGAEDGTSKLANINASVFMGCDSLKTVVLPNNALTLATSAFRGWTGLESIVIPDKVTKFSNAYLFKDCINLVEVTFPAKMTTAGYLGTYAFDGCEKLTTVSLPENLTYIGGYDFQNCVSLENINIPQNITQIGSKAFYNTAISKFTVPAKVTTIGTEAFANCKNLSEVTVDENNKTYFSQDGGIIKKSTGELVYVPYTKSGVLDLSGYAGLVIGGYAFSGCDNITEVILPAGTTKIPSNAFRNFTGLEKITIPEGVEELAANSFDGCINLKEVILPKESLRIIRGSVFNNTPALKTIELPNTIENLTSSAFKGAGFETLTLPECITEVPANLLQDAPNLVTVEFAGPVTMINYSAFQGSGLQYITIPATVTEIKYNVFKECMNLTSITLPETLEVIGYGAFMNSGLKEATIINPELEIGVLSASSTYGLFAGCESLEKVTLPEGMLTLTNYIFANCTSLKTVDLPDSLLALANYAFQGSGVETLTIPAGVKEIPSYAFKQSALKSIVIPEGVVKINGYAFQECPQLESVILPETLEEIGSYVFASTTTIKSIIIPASLMTTSTYNFRYWTADQTIYVRKTMAEVADSWNANWMGAECDANIIYGYQG